MKKDQKTDFLSTRVRYIPINDIRPNPQQPRRRFDSESLQELAASIAAYGILQPLPVRQQGVKINARGERGAARGQYGIFTELFARNFHTVFFL